MIFATGWQATSVCEPKKIKRALLAGRYPAFFFVPAQSQRREKERECTGGPQKMTAKQAHAVDGLI